MAEKPKNEVPDKVQVAPASAIARAPELTAAQQAQVDKRVKKEVEQVLAVREKGSKMGTWPVMAIVAGLIFAFVVPSLIWKDAFQTPQGWLIGGFCLFLGLMAGLIAAFGQEKD